MCFRPGWHNWLARETFTKSRFQENLKVEGSSPSSGESFFGSESSGNVFDHCCIKI